VQKMGCAWKSKQRVSYMLSEVDPDISIKGAFFFRKKSDFKTIDFKKICQVEIFSINNI
jgi:hypothetical protein